MSDHRFIDDALGRVPLPKDLRARLRPEALFADAEIDRLLANVPVPAGLQDSLRNGACAQPTHVREGALDLSRFAPGPDTGPQKPIRRVTLLPPRSTLVSLARDIVSVAAALSLVLVLAVTGIEFSRQLEGTPRRDRTVTRLEFNDPVDETVLDWPLQVDVPGDAWSPGLRERDPALEHLVPAVPDSRVDDRQRAELPNPSTTAIVEPPFRHPSHASTVIRGAAVAPALPSGLRGPPSMKTVDVPGRTRRHVPRVRGYDLAFEMTTGEQPFVDPAIDQTLAIDRPPLSLRTDGFERLTAPHDSGLGPRRAEEILAAIPAAPSTPPLPRDLGLFLHEVRGLRVVGETGTVVLEVATTAGPVPRSSKPSRVTLVIDQSTAGDPAVWRRICRAVGELAAQLSAEDRVSVVLCGPRPRVVLQESGPHELSSLAADLEWQPASASSDLNAGLQLAPAADRIVVLAHANSLDGTRGSLGESLTAWQRALSAAGGDTLACQPSGGTRFIVIDPASPESAEPAEPTFGRTSSDTVSIRRALIQQVTGHKTLVARDCSLEVRFDPRRVARYRLIGHRQSAVESLADSSPRGTDLHAGETVRVVYEVVPRSPGMAPGLASAALVWTSPRGDKKRLESGPNRSADDLGDGLPSPHGCELLLASSLGELAHGSAHLRRRPALVATIEHLIEAWRSRGDITAVGDALARSFERGVSSPRKGL